MNAEPLPIAGRRWPRWWRRAQVAARRSNIYVLIETVSIVAFLATSLLAWFAIENYGEKDRLLPPDLTASLLIGMLVPAMALLVLLGRRMALKRAADTNGSTGRLHVQLVFFFSLIAAIPTLVVALFASWLFQSGVEFWFSDNSRGLLENANKMARGYYEQTQRDVGYESLAMAEDIRSFLTEQPITSPNFPEFFSYQVVNRKLNESAIVHKGADGLLRTDAIVDPKGDSTRQRIAPPMLAKVDAGEAWVVNADANRIEVVTPIDRRGGVYLYTARSSDLLAFSQGQRAENIVRAYEVLTQRARVLQLRFNATLFLLSLSLVGMSVWFALRFADRQVQPLHDLVDAARMVGSGNFAMRVEGRTGADEIGLLNRAFNRMTAQIEKQTQALVSANEQLNERRAFIEAVLESVTAGIVSLDTTGDVQLINNSAVTLLGQDAPTGRPLADIAPSIWAMVETGQPAGIVHYAKGSDLLTLAVKVSRGGSGHVITFEDITRQLLDQRQAAWSDVARRIAHEIKNPLTPIQLATERLKRRYRKQIESDGELFEELTATIIRQVGDLRRMVDEFSSFARLPKPVFRAEDAVDLARQSLFLQEVAHPEIVYRFQAEPGIERILCDRHQFGQAMTNVLKNAAEAIEAQSRNAADGWRGSVSVAMRRENDSLVVAVTDNGIGLPKDRESIVEPYVTTREKGTGLGLAIVNKIVEEHGGDMTFTTVEAGGTTVTLRFARDPLGQQRAEKPE